MITELDEAKLRHPSSGQLQEIIANNSVRAFNSGYLSGAYDERLRLVELAQSYKGKPDFTIDNLISLMVNGEQG